jgi:hypothetical protein
MTRTSHPPISQNLQQQHDAPSGAWLHAGTKLVLLLLLWPFFVAVFRIALPLLLVLLLLRLLLFGVGGGGGGSCDEEPPPPHVVVVFNDDDMWLWVSETAPRSSTMLPSKQTINTAFPWLRFYINIYFKMNQNGRMDDIGPTVRQQSADDDISVIQTRGKDTETEGGQSKTVLLSQFFHCQVD